MFDRAKIMKAAWAIARRRVSVFRESLRHAIRAGLRLAWEDAKDAAQVARKVSVAFAVKCRTVAALSRADLQAQTQRLESQDHLTFADRADLADLRRALAEALGNHRIAA